MSTDQLISLLREGKIAEFNSQRSVDNLNLEGVVLSRLDLSGINLRDARLSGVNFNSCNLTGANFIDAFLDKANLFNANLTEADFSGADISNANLSLTRCTKTVFDNSTCLNGVQFEGADLSEAIFAWNDWQEVRLQRVEDYHRVNGINFCGAYVPRKVFEEYISFLRASVRIVD